MIILITQHFNQIFVHERLSIFQKSIIDTNMRYAYINIKLIDIQLNN